MKHLVISMILALAGLTVPFNGGTGTVAQAQTAPDSRTGERPAGDQTPNRQSSQGADPQPSGGKHDQSGPDHQFAMKVAEANLAEVALADLALNQAADSQVKQFAQQMRDDHTKANDELKAWASKQNMSLPAEPNAKQKQTRDRLSKLSGPEFDKEFVREMVKDHQQVVTLFEKQANSGRDPELKAWATQTLPTLREHLNESRQLAGKLGVGPGNPPKTNKGQ